MHIHSLLSPCGSLEMSPQNIVNEALEKKIDIIAITDHNTTKQAPLIQEIGRENGLNVILGVEVNTSEEVHCLTYFETMDQFNQFQFYLDQHLLPIPNKPETFGDQVIVDKDEMIVGEEKYLLINALSATLNEIEKKVHEIGGMVVPAHVDRPYYGLFSQLGFIPNGFKAEAFELSKNANLEHWKNNGKLPIHASIIQSSDAHFPNQIGEVFTIFNIEEPSFKEIKMALKQENGRSIVPQKVSC